MKRLFLSIITATATLVTFAQGYDAVATKTSMATTNNASANVQPFRFGYFSYREAFKSMPDYVIAQRNIDDLRTKYVNEMKRVEDEFNKKYEQFLEGQKDFAPTILRKRQVELQELIAKNIAFKEEAKRLLAQAETESYAPLKAKLAETLRGIGEARGFMFILNTDNDNLPYANSAFGEDITTLVKECLK